MADHWPARITIGGVLPSGHVARFCRVLGVRDETGLRQCLELGQLVKEDDEARSGEFGELETLCREIGLPYIRQSDGRYEFSPEIAFWAPGMKGPVTAITDHLGALQVDMDTVREIRDALRQGDARAALETAENAVVELPALPPFRIDGTR